MLKVSEEIFEQLAALEHERWSGWMKYMLANMTTYNLMRWIGQMNTLYSDLSEYDKESDRKEVRRTLEILGD